MAEQLKLFGISDAAADWNASIEDNEAGRQLYHVKHETMGVLVHNVGRAHANRSCANLNKSRGHFGKFSVVPATRGVFEHPYCAPKPRR